MFIIFNNQTTFPIDKFASDEKNKLSLKSESFNTILEWWHVNCLHEKFKRKRSFVELQGRFNVHKSLLCRHDFVFVYIHVEC